MDRIMNEQTYPWYMVNKDGVATLCADQADAEQEAKNAQEAWPHMGPHRAVRLVEVGDAGFTAADMATAAARGFREGQAAQAAVAAGWVMVPVIVLESAITALDWMPTSDTTRHLWDKQQPALALLQSALPPRSIY